MNAVPTPTCSVLVIDDHRFQRRMLVRMLGALGVPRVLEASDGANALERLRANRDSLSLIISDVDMPAMDGLEFLRRLAEEAPQTAVAIHSALDHSLLNSVEIMATEYGVHLVGVLEKPASEQALRSILEKAFQSTASPTREPDPTETQVAAALGNPEFVPWFQPKIDLRTGRACGAEVLMRWSGGPHAPPLLPSQSLALIASSGLMRSMTLGLAARSAQCLSRLGSRGRHFTLSLNVCPTLLDDPDFADALAVTLADAGASPGQLILEITESAAARNQGVALENLTRLRMRGFELSIDDFGTGFSSLAQLVRTPFSELKIDRSFVSRLLADGADRLLVDSVITLAKRLGLRTVAEGIETEAQLEILKQLGCELGQGYLFAKPMPIEEWLRWMPDSLKTDSSRSTARGPIHRM
jgi:EAL domain-containing protein (putative c-di-GMP-specific phosphodiesterase class I)/FixJ family two-component response regulator